MALYITALQEGFLYGLLALGVFIALRVLDIPDLTTEGSFGFGAAVTAVLASAGHPFISIPAAILAGALAGTITGLLQTKLRIHPVLSGIITMSGLYSVNLMVMGTTNLAVDKKNALFKMFYSLFKLSSFEKKVVGAALSFAVVLLVLLAVIWFFRTQLGMCIRATGDNPAMVRASSINVNATKIVGLALANALVALSGSLIVHYIGYADANGSSGTLVYGLASVIIGETIFGHRNISLSFVSAVVGSIVYKLIVTFVVDMNLFGKYSANLMKLLCAVIVAVTLAVPAIREAIAVRKVKREAQKNA